MTPVVPSPSFPEPLLKISNLVIGYEGRALPSSAASPLNLEIPKGVGFGILGDNGSGKSTLLKTLAGLIPPLHGGFQWVGEGKNPLRLGYVPQENLLNPLLPLTVMDLLQMGFQQNLSRWGIVSEEFQDSSRRLLMDMNILELQNQRLTDLSRGQRQRAFIARALIGNPDVLLMDEPYSALDESFQETLNGIFQTKKKKGYFSFLMIEHDRKQLEKHVEGLILFKATEILVEIKS